MKITKAQGKACLADMKAIAEGRRAGDFGGVAYFAFDALGWCHTGEASLFTVHGDLYDDFDRDEVLLMLAFASTIAGESL